MKWTTTPPDKPGWWWVRGCGHVSIALVTRMSHGGLVVEHDTGRDPVKCWDCEWSGPIPEPQEAASV